MEFNKENVKIQPINRSTVHRICSGQVVLTLAIAVKELIENSIDAGARNIDIRLIEYGSELIEVSDNGIGVLEENFEALTLKHCTSKISDFGDLESLSTLGFRGEALSSLCALSDVYITTKHKSATHGTKIVYDSKGGIVSKTPVARQEGTTVTLNNIFSSLPVRRTELVKNLKREFNKMCQLLYAYCLVSKGIKFTCTNQVNKGTNSIVVSTEGAKLVKENIVSVFGAKQIASLIDVEMVTPDDEILIEYDVTLIPGEPLPFTMECYISSAMHGDGRSTVDRQFYYVNSRPCEPTKIMKLVNAVYKQFNSNQYPFVYMNVTFEKSQIDVNVTPDKRQVFVAKEKLLLATIKASLLEALKPFPSTFKVANGDLSQSSQKMVVDEEPSVSLRGVKRSVSEKNDGRVEKILDAFKKKAKTMSPRPQERSVVEETAKGKKSCSQLTDFSFTVKTSSNELLETKSCAYKYEKDEKEMVVDAEDIGMDISKATTSFPEKFNRNTRLLCKRKEIEEISFETEEPLLTMIALDEETLKPDSKSVRMKISIGSIKEALSRTQSNCEKSESLPVKFRAEIAPEHNKMAEEELQKQITKDMFKKMRIVGQFNLGFIVTKLGSDLFLIDQHASDEKYNFEELQKTCILEHQKLVTPKQLELTAGNETLLIENQEIFLKNGFTFNIDHNAPSTKKVSLTTIPMSKNYAFGKDDIDEMIFMLQDDPTVTCRPSRVRALFASRACRKSVMVGKPLNKVEMREIVDHMSELDQPWNCPHGRPTMRHLVNLDLLQES